MSASIKTRLLILSDTHARTPNPSCRWSLQSADVAIHTGDLTMNGKTSEHEQAVELLKNLSADLKIVIPGNHDLTLDAKYYATFAELHGPMPKYKAPQLQQIRDLYTNAEAQAANIVYLEEGTQTFKLKNGASLTIYASAYTPEFYGWAFAYERDEDRYNDPNAANPVPNYTPGPDASNIDVMLTHGPPMGILDQVQNRQTREGTVNVGCEHLLHAVARAKPLLHCFGHIHEAWGGVRKTWASEQQDPMKLSADDAAANCADADVDYDKLVQEIGAHVDATDLRRGEETLFVNSSIMNLRYRPVQDPWVVDLMLDRHE